METAKGRERTWGESPARDHKGRVPQVRRTLAPENRFWRYVAVDPETGCWEWTGVKHRDGYGFLWVTKYIPAHKFSWEFVNGPVPEGQELDHLCRNRGCVNDEHLEPVTRRENIMRSPIAPSAINARKTHCIRGHPLYGPNVRWRGPRKRACRACEQLRNSAAWKQIQKAERAALVAAQPPRTEFLRRMGRSA